MPKINLKDIPDSEEDGSFIPVPKGTYKARVDAASYSKEGTKEFVLVTFKITSGEQSGLTVRNWFHLAHPEARRITMEQLKLLGIPTNFNPMNAGQLVGLECQIVTDMSADDKYAPSDQKPRKILDSLGLTGRKENLGKIHGGNRVYHINTDELINVLESNNYTDLLEKITWYSPLTILQPLTAFTKKGERGEETHHLVGRTLKYLIQCQGAVFAAAPRYKHSLRHCLSRAPALRLVQQVEHR